MHGEEIGLLLKINAYGKYSVDVVAISDGKVVERSTVTRDRAMTSAFKVFREETDRLAQSLSRGLHQFEVAERPNVKVD